MNLHNMRTEFKSSGLKMSQLAHNPLEQFHVWMQDAIQKYGFNANAMTLATADENGRPSARMVLLKDYDERGFSFFTNYRSPKAQQLMVNPQAALLFYWPRFNRQVRIEGQVEKVSAEYSREYFQIRPWKSQVGAWSSPQSRPIRSREELLGKVAINAVRFVGRKKLPLPDFWGGFTLIPDRYEFWQGQPSRLHDRFLYLSEEKQQWKIERVAP